jgi:iron(III) transport system permease protein
VWPALLVLGYHVFHTRNTRYRPLVGRISRDASVRLGPWRWPAFAAVTAFVFVAVVLPLASLITTSFMKFRTPEWSKDVFTVRNYTDLLEADVFWRALANTAKVSVVGASIGVVLALLIAYVGAGRRGVAASLASYTSLLTLAVPGFCLGLGFLWTFLSIQPLRSISGTTTAIVIALVAAFIGLGIRVIAASFVELPASYEEAARMAGAGVWRRLVWVVAPMLGPTIASVWRIFLVIFVLDLNVVIFLFRGGSETLSVLTFVYADQRPSSASFALGTLQVLIVTATFILITAVTKLRRRAER